MCFNKEFHRERSLKLSIPQLLAASQHSIRALLLSLISIAVVFLGSISNVSYNFTFKHSKENRIKVLVFYPECRLDLHEAGILVLQLGRPLHLGVGSSSILQDSLKFAGHIAVSPAQPWQAGACPWPPIENGHVNCVLSD